MYYAHIFSQAFKVCEKKDLVPEMVFILGRMGDNKKALMLIIERLGDVQRVCVNIRICKVLFYLFYFILGYRLCKGAKR